MAGVRWLFTKDELSSTPSIKNGYPEGKELAYRQNAAHLIQNMGQKLQLNQLCINTAIVYMHRFYMYYPLQKFPWRNMSAACLFLAAKVEEQPRKLEFVIKAAHHFISRQEDGTPAPPLDTTSSAYLERVQDLVINENILLQALGFNVTIDHSNTQAVKICNLVKAPRDLSQLSYFLSTNSLLLTNMCLQYPPKIIASVCIHLACKWSDWELPRSHEGKYWWQYVDGSLSREKLDDITNEFLSVMEKADPKLKKQIMTGLKVPSDSSPNSRSNSPAPQPSARTPQHPAAAAASSSHHPGGGSAELRAYPPPKSGHGDHAGVAKTYAEHKERNRAAAHSDGKTRPIHGESPLVRGDKRPYPRENTHLSQGHGAKHGVPANSSPPPHPASAHHPAYIAPASRNHDGRHGYRHHPGVPVDSSPVKKPRLGETNNGDQRPPLPAQPPLPKPPPPPP